MQLITCHLYGSDGHVRPFRILSNLAGGLSTYLRLMGGGGVLFTEHTTLYQR